MSTPTGYLRPRMHFADLVSGRPFAKDPSVIRFRDRWLMYYSVAPHAPRNAWSIGVAESTNLLDWHTVARLPFAGGAEAKGFAAPGAIVLGDRVHLFYQSYGNGPADALCHAVSDDGLHFTRSSNPVFAPTGAWTVGRAIDAEPVVFGDRLLLYFATRDPTMRTQFLGVASAPLHASFQRDAWTHLTPAGPCLAPRTPTPLDPPGQDLAWELDCIEAPTATVRSGLLYLFYAGGYNNHPQQIGVAVSRDGLDFRRLLDGRPLVPVGAPGTWNDRESGHPAYLPDPVDPASGWLFFQGNNRAESLAAQGDTWYLSTLRVRWTPAADGTEIPTVSPP